MPVKIHLAVSLVPVGPRKTNIAEQYFALHLSAAFDAEYGVEFHPLLHPWKSGWEVPGTSVAVELAGGGPPAVLPTAAVDATPKKPAAQAEGLRLLQNEVVSGKQRVWNPVHAINTAGSSFDPNLVESIHNMSLYAGAIPNTSRILHYVKIEPNGWPPQLNDQMAVAPTLVLRHNAVPITFTPDTFDFTKWNTDGWAYTSSDPANFQLTAWVKPLRIADAAGIYHDPSEIPPAGKPSGLNFKDYWFRSERTPMWREKLADISSAATDLEARMADAVNPRFDVDANWESLRLMALGLYAQWSPNGDLAVHNGAVIKQNLVNAASIVQAELDAALVLQLNALKSSIYADNKKEWRAIFERAFKDLPSDADVADDALLRRFIERRDDFEPILFFIWDHAVRKYGAETLKASWKTFFHTPATSAAGQEFIRQNFAASAVRGRMNKYLFDELSKKAASGTDARQEQRDRMDNLQDYLRHADFVPKLVDLSNGPAGPAGEVWLRWEEFTAEYIKYLFGDEAGPAEVSIETKPSGLTIQFDEIEKRNVVAPSMDDSRWRRIAGVGIVVREKDKKWHCATVATLETGFPQVRIVERDPVGTTPNKLVVKLSANSPDNTIQSLFINNVLFKDVLEIRAMPSGTLPAHPSIRLVPSNIVHDASMVEVTIESIDPNLKFTDADKIEFTVKPEPLLAETTLVPARVPNKEGVRFPFLTYDQRSITAPTALADAVKKAFYAEDSRAVGTKWAPLYRFGPPVLNGGETSDFFRLVPLKFGKTYEIAAFMMDTAGGLPGQLHNGHPYVFKANTDIMWGDQDDDAERPKIVQEIRYWRKVPVGQVRITELRAPDKTTNKLEPAPWKEVPENVFPQGWEVDPDTKQAADKKKDEDKTEMILLPEATARFSFGIRPPSVDVDVFERWLPFLSKDHLVGVLKDYFGRLNNVKEAPADTSIDDPAVSALLLVLENYDFDTREWKVVSAYKHTLPPPGAGLPAAQKDTLKARQMDWQAVICKPGNENEVRAPKTGVDDEKGYAAVVVVKNDGVHVTRLRTVALVPNDFVDVPGTPSAGARFSSTFFNQERLDENGSVENIFKEDTGSYTYEDPGGPAKILVSDIAATHVCLKSHRILLETPNAVMPKPIRLWKSLDLQLSPVGDVVDVLLAHDSDAVERAARRNVVRCELRRQQWRWQGRPIERENHNDIETLMADWAKDGVVKGSIDNKDFLLWEMTAFGDMREDFDLLKIPLPYSMSDPGPIGAPIARLLYSDSFKTDHTGRYVRYGLEVFSRYQGLFPIQRSITKQPYDGGTLSGTGWKRVLVRYRGDKPAKPLIQAIVPLTQTFSGTNAASSLMLVLDQTAFAQCGITERIECELIRIKVPGLKGGVTPEPPLEQRHQLGPDGIVRVEPKKPVAVGEPLRFHLSGPFGHTHDTGARQPLFGCSSYVIDPQLVGDTGDPVPVVDEWDFAKIRVRRLRAPGPRIADETDWTDAVWVQFPPSSDFVVSGKLAVSVTNNTSFEVNFNADTRITEPFKYGLLLTREIVDFRGQSRSETYWGWVNLASADPKMPLKGQLEPGVSLPPNAKMKARLVEVQVAPEWNDQLKIEEYKQLPDTSAKFWEGLLATNPSPSGDLDNLEYRITRISKGIDLSLG